MAEANDGESAGRETLDDVVDGDIGRAADEDALVEAGELENEFYERVCFTGLVKVSLWHLTRL